MSENYIDHCTKGGVRYDYRDAGAREILDGLVNGVIYGFHIDASEADPSACVTYLRDAVGMVPAGMDYITGTFNWGSWRNAFFLPRPCMLRYDGTVDYYLDPSDYAKREDGVTASDVDDASYAGNAMMEWGQNGRKIWYKIVPDVGDSSSASVYIADYQADGGYHAWSFVNHQGAMVDHFYTAIYNGSIDGSGRLRSISGKTYADLCKAKTAPQEVAAAEANNPSTDKLWYTEVYADITLINLLLVLMGKSLDTQAVFGAGHTAVQSDTPAVLGTGTMDDKGLFWGSDQNIYGVKAFGMENWWGNQWRRYAGHVMIDYIQKYKMTRGRQDGSTVDDYVCTGTAADYEGYLVGATGPNTSDFITAMQFDNNCLQVKTTGGASANSTHYWCDRWYQRDGVMLPRRGGRENSGVGAGAFILSISGGVEASPNIGASLSCKPLAAS